MVGAKGSFPYTGGGEKKKVSREPSGGGGSGEKEFGAFANPIDAEPS